MSEEKTKIVPRSQPKVAGEQITFSCDNGHRIVVPVKLAGKRGTCSKCGIPVIIPALLPTGNAAPQPEAEQPQVPFFALPTDGGQETQAAEPEPLEKNAAEPNEFAGLFDAVSADQSRNSGGSGAVTADSAEQVVEEVASGSAIGSALGNVVANAAAGYAEGQGTVAVDNPTAQLVARLWIEREHGGIVEIHITGGGVILPQWYEPMWSRGTHGLFASQAADGSVTLTAVAWDSIQKIIVRQVEGLPDGMFE